MPRRTERDGVQYVDFSDEYLDDVVRPRMEMFLEASVIVIRDEIVRVINEGSPTGRLYRLPTAKPPFKREDGSRIESKWYRASAPGEPPAVRTATYRNSWDWTEPTEVDGRLVATVFNPVRVGSRDEHPLWAILELGASTAEFVIEPRPHIEKGVRRAMPKIRDLGRRVARGA